MSAEIVALDAALDRAGEDVVLSRAVKRSGVNVAATVTCRAAVRTVSGDQILGTLTQETMRIVISPSQILAAGWPGQDDSYDASGSTVPPYLPRATDTVLVRGKKKQVKIPGEIYVDGVWVRNDMVVAG